MGWFDARVGMKPLAALCRRLATALGAGVDMRGVWQREADSAGGAMQQHLSEVALGVAGGRSVADSLAGSGEFFPELFRRIVDIGERSGGLPEALSRLADHYDHRLHVRRTLLARLAWPMIQLAFAIAVVGLLIWFPGYISRGKGPPLDLLGLGLIGTRGLAIYAGLVTVAGVVVAIVVRSVLRGGAWVRGVESLALAIPGVSHGWKTLALWRLTWSLQMTLNTTLDIREAVAISLRSSGLWHFAQQTDSINATLSRGDDLPTAFRQTGVFPPELLDALAVGEQTGRTVESLAHLSREYERQSQVATQALAQAVAFAIWALVAAFFVAVIFRVFFSYLNMYRQFLPK